MRTILDLLAISAASIANFISGFMLVNIGRVHTRLFSETGMELPMISKASAAYTATSAPIVVGLMFGFATLAGLGWVFRSERLRCLLPFLLSLSFVVVILHIVFVAYGVTIPYVLMTRAMEQ